MLDEETVVAAFSEDHVERLTGITKSQLLYWDRTNFFTPSFADQTRRVAFSRLYSFKDVVALRTLSVLRNQYAVPLQHLRQVAEKLRHLEDRLWTATALYVVNKRVHFVNEETQRVENVLLGQYVLGIRLQVIVSDTERDVEKFRQRPAETVGHIERNRILAHNAWVVAGTRIPVSAIKNFHDAGYSVRQIIEEYPDPTERDVEAALTHNDQHAA